MIKSKVNILLYLLLAGVLYSCSISYKFTGTSIDYTRVRSISIKDFPNMAPLVYPPMSQMLTESLIDKYTRQTKLQILRDGGDLDLEGEITGYTLTPQAVKDDAYASETRMTITVRVRFSNQTNPEDDFEQTYSAYETFSNNLSIDEAQDVYCEMIFKEIVDQIYNETVAKW